MKMHSHPARLFTFLLVLVAAEALPADNSSEQIYPRQLLIEDARQLRDTIEQAHPDPYLNGGGKVAFHRRFHQMLCSLPQEGLTAGGFLRLLQPFVAAIGDSHTGIRMATGAMQPLSLPLDLRIVEQHLVVDRVADRQLEPLLGARLQALQGVPVAELLRRQANMRGMENVYGHLALLTLRTLKSRQSLDELLPELQQADTIEVELTLRSGQELQTRLDLLTTTPDDWVMLPSRVELPPTTYSDVSFTFLDDKRETALLVIADLMRYREACELWFADGLAQAEMMAGAAFEHFHQSPAPDSRDELLAGIPPATETIVELVHQARAAGTRNLIVDLRGNTGGNSAMREILVYLLFGKEAMLSLDNGYQIVKHSPLLHEQYDAYSLAEINQRRPYPLTASDYDFHSEEQYLQSASDSAGQAELTLAKSPTFWQVFQSGDHHQPLWSPDRVLVLCSPSTFSSGFNVLTGLYALGAEVVGTPSAQPANSFGDMLRFQLRHSGIEVAVSFKQNVTFPDDPELGRCLRPHHALTIEQLAAYDFDPNAEVLLALEVLRERS
jgi:hypothetical protein